MCAKRIRLQGLQGGVEVNRHERRKEEVLARKPWKRTEYPSKLVPGPRIEWINFSCKCGFKGVAAAKNNVLTCPGCQSQFDLEV